MLRAACALMVVFGCSGAFAADQAPAGASPQQQGAANPSAPAASPADTRLDNLQKPDGETPAAAESWWQKIVREAPHCKSFTDGCRTCSLTVCSNIGIACQPKEWSCNDANEAKPKGTPDATPDSRK